MNRNKNTPSSRQQDPSRLIAYCANVHPIQSVDDFVEAARGVAVPSAQAVGLSPALGLWLPESVASVLAGDPKRLETFAGELADLGVVVPTANAFPYGDFHQIEVKEAVYQPTWADPTRLAYTLAVAQIINAVAPRGRAVSISTVPLGFKGHDQNSRLIDQSRPVLVQLARKLAEIADKTGRVIRIGLEPEPGCVLETTGETVAFFDRLRDQLPAADRQAVETFVGVCFDCCHQAVEWEDIEESIATLDAAHIPVVKVHLSSAIELSDPNDDLARAELAHFAEPRYLHQTYAAPDSAGVSLRVMDLTAAFALNPPRKWCDRPWRTHFHVPISKNEFGRLGTTQSALTRAIAALADTQQNPDWEVETYTWPVLLAKSVTDKEARLAELAAGISDELSAAKALLDAINVQRCAE